MRLLENADVFAPQALGMQHLLLAAGHVVWMGPKRPDLPAVLEVRREDLQGRRVVPGFVDCHTHLTGGGGESGYASRVPPMALPTLASAGVTTAVGLLGTDDLVHTPVELVAVARGLRALGLTTYCWTGGYHVPPATITGSVRGDMMHVDLVIGAGEIAISDHRSSQPTLPELLRLAGEVHVGGLMTDKAGVLHLHLGDGSRGLDLVRRALSESELPPRVFHPTHVNRRQPLLEEAFALAAQGCTIDVTAFPPTPDPDETTAADALVLYRDQGLPPERVTLSSDGGGCLPNEVDDEGRIVSMSVGTPDVLGDTLQDLVGRGVPLDHALLPLTSNPATLLRLPGVGHIGVGAQADLVVLDDDTRVDTVFARGRALVRGGTPVVRGSFESRGA